MVKPFLDVDAVSAPHPKRVCSWFIEGNNYAYQKSKWWHTLNKLLMLTSFKIAIVL
jgi:hypothetical protein